VPLIVDNTAAPVLCRRSTTAPRWSALDDEIYRRPRHLDRRHRRRWRQFRLGKARRPAFRSSQQPDPAYHGAVWTQAVNRWGRSLYHQDAGDLAARPGAGGGPVQFLPAQSKGSSICRCGMRAQNCAQMPRRSPAALRNHPKVRQGNLSGGDGRRAAGAGRRRSEGRLWRALGFELKAARMPDGASSDALQMFYHVANIGRLHVRSANPPGEHQPIRS